MSRPRSPVTPADVQGAIEARVLGELAVTAVDVATELGISRRGLHDLLVRETGAGFAAFRRSCPFLPTSGGSDPDHAGMVSITALVPGCVAGRLRRQAADERTSPAVVAGRLLADSFPAQEPAP